MALKDILHVALVCVLLQEISFRSANVATAQRRSELIKDPIIYYTTTELACSEGYPAQEHKVVTEDGYVLTVQRIPRGRSRPKVPRRKTQYHYIHLEHHPDFDDCINESKNLTGNGIPVLFVHGLLMASDAWLLQGPGSDLAYILADKGYDVWFANIRGNFYSRNHTTMSPSDPKFWNFSFHENAVIDLPAIIDYILNETKMDKVGYVGISMGTTMFFAMASTRPEYNDKILGFVGLAPVAYIKQRYMNYRRRTLFDVLEKVGFELERRGNVHEVFPKNSRLLNLGRNYCSKGSDLQDFCYDLVTLVLGHPSKLTLRKILHLYATHTPTGTSLKTFLHYIQNIKGNSFKMYDYGNNNMEVYGSPTPPDYQLWNITAPVALHYTDKDFYYDIKDIRDLKSLLPNVMVDDNKPNLNHGDFLWSFKAKNSLYRKASSYFNTLRAQYYLEKRRKKSIAIEKNTV